MGPVTPRAGDRTPRWHKEFCWNDWEDRCILIYIPGLLYIYIYIYVYLYIHIIFITYNCDSRLLFYAT